MTVPVKFVFDGESSGMERAYKTGNKLVEELIRTVTSMAPAYQVADNAANQLLKRNADLEKGAVRLRQTMVTPQSEYKAAIDLANQALQNELITEGEYAMAVDRAKAALDAKDVSLQKTLNDATRIKAAAVTPEQAHAAAINSAKSALDRKLITQKEYDSELQRQNELLNQARSAQINLGAASQSVMGQFATELTGMGGLFASVGGTIALVRTEIQEFRDSQKTASERQLDTAQAERNALFALGDDPTMSPERLSQEADRISIKNGVSKKKVYEDFANSLSSKAALTADDAIAAAEVATAVAPHQGSTQLAGSVLDLKNRFGGTAEQMMGMMLGGQQVSRVKDQAAYATNVVPTIKALGGYGDSPEQATALTGGMSNSMTDLQGNKSSTAIENLAKQLAEALPFEKTGLKNTTERIMYFWDPKHDKEREKFFGNDKTGAKGTFHFEAGAYIPIKELVKPGETKAKQDYLAALAGTPSMAQSGEYYNKALTRVDRQPLQIQSAKDRALKVAADQASLADLEGGSAASAREGMDTALKQSGVGFFSRFITARQLDLAEFTGSAKPSEFAANTLAARANELNAGHNYEGNIVPATPTELRMAAALEQVATTMQGLNVAMQQTTDATRQNTAATKQAASTPSARPMRPAHLQTKSRPSELLQNNK